MTKLIIASIGLIFAGSIFFAYTKPSYANIGILKAQIAQYDEALQKAAELDERMSELLNKRNSFSQADIDRLQLMLPDHADNIALILELDSLASHYGMALANADVTADSSTAGGGEESAGDVIGNTPSYSTITLHFSTFGTYEHFRSFMRDLETSLRLVDLVSLTISPDLAIKGSYSYDVTIKTYWLK